MAITLELSKTAQKIFNELKTDSLDYLEKKRLAYLVKFNVRRKIIWRFSLPLLFIVVALDIYFNNLQPRIAIYAVIPLIFSIYVKIPRRHYKRKYIKFFNKKFIPAFLMQMFGYNYLNKSDILQNELDNFKLIGDYHTYFGEDYMYGKIDKNIDMQFEESHLIGPFNNFKGGIMLLKMPENTNGRIVIRSKAIFRDNANMDRGLERLEIRDKTFEKYFEVLTTDIKMADNIITDKLMKKIVETSKKLHDLFNEEFLQISPAFQHRIDSYKSTADRKMETATLEIEFRNNQILFLLRGQYDILAPVGLAKSVYCEDRLSVIEQEFKALESLVKLIRDNK